MTLIDIIAGARPNFIKVSSIIDALRDKEKDYKNLKFRLIHTGQHYDESMSGDFFSQLNIPKPDVNLEVGSGSQAEQTGKIMERYESLLKNKSSNLTLVVGDVNSTVACSIVARKSGIPVAHVEAGIRSGDWSMPEEINRVVTDSVTNYFFTTSEIANKNLIQSGMDKKHIFLVGNTMIDTLLKNKEKFSPPTFWKDIGLKRKKYFVLTLHRPSNVDNQNTMLNILNSIINNSREFPIIFPVHPRSAKNLSHHKLSDNLVNVDPQPYLQFNYLVQNSLAVITDSGGITEEATVMGVPCLTLRDNTERPETVTLGTNELIGTNTEKYKPHFSRLFENKWKKGSVPPYWDGKAGERIVKILNKILSKNL